jgi:pimeloyl-ACP methyl ester carboxylesterase
MSGPAARATPGGKRSLQRDPDGRAGVVELPDGRLLASRRWPGRGVPLVALHGLFDCSLGWKHVAAASRRPHVAFDLPGFGRSGMPAESRFSSYAQDILCALDILEVDRFSLVGHSLGGAVAAELAERAAERTLNLTLLAPAGFGPVPVAELLEGSALGRLARLGVPLALSNPLSAVGIYMALVSHGRPPERQLLGRVIRRAFTTAPGAIAANQAIVSAARDPDGFAHRPVRYDGPVSVLWGTSDILMPVSHAAHVCVALPQAKLTVWEGMGHHPQRERPQQLNDYLATTTRTPTSTLAAAA